MSARMVCCSRRKRRLQSGRPNMAPDEPTSTALVPYIARGRRDRAAQWSALAPDELRRDAMAAANAHNAGALGELCSAYVLLRGRQHGAVSDHTLRSYTSGVAALCRAWSAENLLHPSPDAGDRYIAAISADHSPGTCASRLAAAGALYRALRWARATTADPFAGVQAPRDRTPRHERRHPYSDAQVEAIAGAADNRLRLLILLTAHGGLRIAEALALRWDDVDIDGARLRVLAGKGGKVRTVHVSGTLHTELEHARRRRPDDEARVVLRADGEASRDASWLRRRLQLACELAGQPYLGFHAFRHTAGTRLARETGNLQLVAAHLGHADVSTAAIYAKWSDQALEHAVAAW